MMNLTDTAKAGRLARVMIGASARLNYEWALRRPGKPPFLVLTEFPRSGGNWIRDMLGDALQMPVPRMSRLPITFRAIIHNHDHRLTRHPTVYVVRDPRDVFLSHFHKTVATLRSGSASVQRRVLSRHPSLAPILSGAAPMTCLGLGFYQEWSTRPLGARVAWNVHVRQFFDQPPETVVPVRYEDMLANGQQCLEAVVERLAGKKPPADVLAFAVARNEFGRQTNRKAGKADNQATKRQGLAGAWQREMPPEIADRIRSDMGDELEMAGYDR